MQKKLEIGKKNRNASLVITEPKLKEKVIEHLKKNGPSTRAEVANDLNKLHSSITGRLNELLNAGKIIESGSKKDKQTNRFVTTYVVKKSKNPNSKNSRTQKS